jgi:hypothetical protein
LWFEYGGVAIVYRPDVTTFGLTSAFNSMGAAVQTAVDVALDEFRRSQEFQDFQNYIISYMTVADFTQFRSELVSVPIIRNNYGLSRNWDDAEQLIFSRVNTALEVTMWTGERSWFDMAFYNVERGEQPTYSYVQGVAVTAWTYNFWGEIYQLGADFMFEGNTYAIRTMETCEYLAEGKQRLKESVNRVIAGGGVDFTVIAPQLDFTGFRSDRLSLEMARNDEQFGAFVPNPATFPEQFRELAARPPTLQRDINAYGVRTTPIFPSFEIFRNVNTRENVLDLFWVDLPYHFSWHISELTEDQQVVTYEEYRRYGALRRINYRTRTIGQPEVVNTNPPTHSNPIFAAEDVTLDLIRSQSRTSELIIYLGPETDRNVNVSISIFLDGAVIRISSTGIPAEDIWEMLNRL